MFEVRWVQFTFFSRCMESNFSVVLFSFFCVHNFAAGCFFVFLRSSKCAPTHRHHHRGPIEKKWIRQDIIHRRWKMKDVINFQRLRCGSLEEEKKDKRALIKLWFRTLFSPRHYSACVKRLNLKFVYDRSSFQMSWSFRYAHAWKSFVGRPGKNVMKMEDIKAQRRGRSRGGNRHRAWTAARLFAVCWGEERVIIIRKNAKSNSEYKGKTLVYHVLDWILNFPPLSHWRARLCSHSTQHSRVVSMQADWLTVSNQNHSANDTEWNLSSLSLTAAAAAQARKQRNRFNSRTFMPFSSLSNFNAGKSVWRKVI